MKCEPLAIPDVLLLEPVRHADARGFFSETYVYARFAAAG
ncbi:MAG: dTDP-4-dehydrorhamnose 3,5-epimerase family protein, partial [Alphaproteobacteria bacterium]|nr:dTDP-4-dehydrorhamnose 3,5-epimerase family protein [Alphaproteobacteria bacterium]